MFICDGKADSKEFVLLFRLTNNRFNLSAIHAAK